MNSFIPKLIELYNSNLEFAGFVAYFTLALIVFVISQFALALFNHRAAKREYQYERSKATGTARFEKETFHLEMLSASLAQLVSLSANFPDKSIFTKAQWQSIHKECVARLGASAPFLNYISENGGQWCGVADKQFESGQAGSGCSTRKSLYRQAAELIDSCAMNMGGFFSCEVTFILEIDIPHAFSIDEREDLLRRYERFVHCAYCRLRNCEEGRKDARRHRREAYFMETISSIKFLDSAFHYYDVECPCDGANSSKRKSIKDVMYFVAYILLNLLKYLVCIIALVILIWFLFSGLFLIAEHNIPDSAHVNWAAMLLRFSLPLNQSAASAIDFV